ncbi:PEP-CTERM sorting domain-containing protein [Vibrio sp. 2-Bac 85]|uniref:PEP-CTERM sorting domain-containing protein n=1 Tax=uncultured Psychromonas sp. TaxID=173974 RepID=UPI00261905AE|nr:PEP-CTERM sorting domain-containing protein [uncultured Psychromonas sp.]
MKKLIASIALITASLNVQAIPTYVGSYEVNDGPSWSANPDVYSATDAAALIFGGNSSDYYISTFQSFNYADITHTGWYDGWGEHSGMEFNENYSLDVNGDGYANPGGSNTAHSAYVNDGLNNSYVNYVWLSNVVSVPEPISIVLLGLGLAGLGFSRKKKKV